MPEVRKGRQTPTKSIILPYTETLGMEQRNIGNFIAAKRREQNLTQEQLAARLGVSNKTISKWENGKCMPDYSVIELLCKELGITLAELLDGEEKEPNSIRGYDEEQVKSLLEKLQNLE